MDPHFDHFRLEITSLADFVAFVAVIRGQTFDLNKLAEMTAHLRKSTNDLAAAETDTKE